MGEPRFRVPGGAAAGARARRTGRGAGALAVRIGGDAPCWANERGYGRFTRELVTAMAARAPGDELVCFLDPASAAVFELGGSNVRQVVVGQGRSQVHAPSADGYRSPFDVFRLSRAARSARPDVFFFPAPSSHHPLPYPLP